MKNKSLIFAVIGAAMIIAITCITNYYTSPGFPWAIFPVFGVLWWPLSVYFGRSKKFKAFSVVGSLLIAGLAYLVYAVTSGDFPWYIFPVFGVLWWPLAMILGTAGRPKLFAAVSALYISAFFVLVNYVTSPAFPWAMFPIFGVMWWPLSVIINPSKRGRLFSILGSIYIILFLFAVNFITSWGHPWFIYPAFGVLWWPFSVIICGAKKYKLYAVLSVIYITAFLALVNYITSPQYAWFYYPVYGLLWWPLSMFLAKKPKLYSVVMSLLTLGYLMLINYQNSPTALWYPYAAFSLIWWPLAMFLGEKAKSIWFAVFGALSIIAYYVFLYYRLTPGAHPWYLYIILPAIWWPVTYALKDKAASILFQIISILIFAAYYSILNLILTPGYFWAINLIYPMLWALMGIYFGHTKKYFAFSICAAVVTIVYFSILNYMTTPHIIWAVYPSFAILWWPLSMYFFKVKKEKPLKAVN